MTYELYEDYPEAAEYIYRAVEEHGEEWVIENYYEELYSLGLVMDVPEREELPFYEEQRDGASEE